MTATSLRDRIAQALHHEGAYCGNCGYENDIEDCPDCELILYGYARAIERLLADADPTDLGFKWVDGITYCTFHDATVTAERARAGACDRAHHFCAEVPVYTRPRTKETTDG